MMGEGWIHVQPSIQLTTSINPSLIPNPNNHNLPNNAKKQNPAEHWKQRAQVDQMQECCGHCLYVLQKDALQPTIDEQICKDVPRTFPGSQLLYISENGRWSQAHHNLHKILRAYAALDPQVGYCQGMNFLASFPLFHMPPDESFWVFSFMMHEFGWREYFLPHFPRLRRSLAVLDRLIEHFLPKLAAHLKDNDINITTFTTQWFLTAFTYNFTFDSAVRAWDLIFVEGHDATFAISLVIIQQHATKISGLSGQNLQEYLLSFAKDMLFSPSQALQATDLLRSSLRASLAMIESQLDASTPTSLHLSSRQQQQQQQSPRGTKAFALNIKRKLAALLSSNSPTTTPTPTPQQQQQQQQQQSPRTKPTPIPQATAFSSRQQQQQTVTATPLSNTSSSPSPSLSLYSPPSPSIFPTSQSHNSTTTITPNPSAQHPRVSATNPSPLYGSLGDDVLCVDSIALLPTVSTKTTATPVATKAIRDLVPLAQNFPTSKSILATHPTTGPLFGL